MSDVFSYAEGSTPLLISVPHDGRDLPVEVRQRMTPEALELPDTDWHVAALYDFAAGIGASTIVARYSRYVIDLNRAASDETLYEGQVATGLCPHETFAGEPIYRDGGRPSAAEKSARTEKYWRPYHDEIQRSLDRLRESYGYALLWDAHSIPSRVPRLFDGELPVLNVGTFDGRSCASAIVEPLLRIASGSPYETAFNARFKGGYITRHYGDPEKRVHALQLEIAQRAYMDEESRTFDTEKATALLATLEPMVTSFLHAAGRCLS